MDCRCPRKLKDSPTEYCPLAVQRLRWLESLGREATEKEEEAAPGCPWAIRNHDFMFCFFKKMEEIQDPMSDIQIAHSLGISEQTMKKTKDRAIAKLRTKKMFVQMKDIFGDDPIVTERTEPYESELNEFFTSGDVEICDSNSESGTLE
jgi:hypothetical protein